MHGMKFELLACLVGGTQYVRRQSEWAVSVSYEKRNLARAARRPTLAVSIDTAAKPRMDAIILEFGLNGRPYGAE